MAKDLTLYVSQAAVRDAEGFFAVPDQLDVQSAEAFARKIARYHAAQQQHYASQSQGGSKLVDLCELIGHADAGNIDSERAWAATLAGPPFADEEGVYHWGSEWMRFVIGRDPLSGRAVALDFKEAHEFEGMGHHMVLVGTTGSGKSQFLTTLITSACLTHSPDSLNIAFFDFKGSATAHLVAQFPHMVANMRNLRNDSLWIPRMGDVLLGELDRRQELLDRADVSDVAEYEYLRIHKGEKRRPIPHLLVIVDEFTEMFIAHPDAKRIMDKVGRQGRSLGVRLLMASQRLGHEMAQGIMSNVPIRTALRTVGDQDSRELLGSDEANFLPVKPAGSGLLKVSGSKRLTRFQTAFVAKPYIPPRAAVPAAVRATADYSEPQEFSVTGMAPWEETASAPGPAEPAPRAVVGADGRALKQVQAIAASLARQHNRPVRPMWLPPLTPIAVDELVRRLRGRPWHEGYGVTEDVSALRLPVGIEDQPSYHRQFVYAPNLSESNCAVIGESGSGKTVAIATMIAGAALMYSPARVQFFVLNFSGPDLNLVQHLPHIGGFARETDAERVRRILAEVVALIDEREQAFGALGLRLDRFRARKFGSESGEVPADSFGDVFLVIDGWAMFRESFEALVPSVMRILARGPRFGVHGIISAQGWIASGFVSGMKNLLTSNVELKLASNDETSENSSAVAKQVPKGEKSVFVERDDAEPDSVERAEESQQTVRVVGRGTSMDGFHFQTGQPQLSMQGRIVDIDAATDWIVEQAGADASATQVRVLPRSITLDEVFRQWQARPHRVPGEVPFGISEVALLPAVANFRTSPHLLFTGRPECGLSSALSTIAQSLMRLYTPEQARIYVIDPYNDLLQVVDGPHLGEYAFQEDAVRALAKTLAAELEVRKPAGNLSQAELAELVAGGKKRWSGPEIFVLVDREEELHRWDRGGFGADTGHPLLPLVPLVNHGREIGFHLVVARRIAQWMRAVNSPLVGQLYRGSTPGVVMDGDRADGVILGNTKAEAFDPGRGVYVTDTVAAPVQIALPARP